MLPYTALYCNRALLYYDNTTVPDLVYHVLSSSYGLLCALCLYSMTVLSLTTLCMSAPQSLPRDIDSSGPAVDMRYLLDTHEYSY